eukprot:11360378-Alexandrium_andersonii.AAC.1
MRASASACNSGANSGVIRRRLRPLPDPPPGPCAVRKQLLAQQHIALHSTRESTEGLRFATRNVSI